MASSDPGPIRVPEGPRRRFLQQLRLLHDSSGRPSARRISAAIRQNDNLPDTASHETVAALLRGDLIPAWSKVECIVTALGERSINKYDAGVLLRHFHSLWLDTVQDQETVIEAAPDAAVNDIHAAASPVAGAVPNHAQTGIEAFVADLTSADRPAEIWICAYLRSATQQLRDLATSLGDNAVLASPLREACREKMLANIRLLTRFLLVKSPGEWTAWDFAPRWTPGPPESIQRLRYWYGATTQYSQRMKKDSNARYSPVSLDEFDVEGTAVDCLALMAVFIDALTAAGSPYASFIDSNMNVAW